jgi:hypothetical protein
MDEVEDLRWSLAVHRSGKEPSFGRWTRVERGPDQAAA